jgi:hypothetical protein
MIVLLAIVLVLMFAANRPEFWVHLVPGLDSKPPANATKTKVEIAPAAQTESPAPRPQGDQTDHPQSDQTKLRLVGLIILAVLYFGWRFARMGRALSRHRPPKRVRPPDPGSTPSISNGG